VYTLRVAMLLWTGLNFSSRKQCTHARESRCSMGVWHRNEVVVLCLELTGYICINLLVHCPMHCIPEGLYHLETLSAYRFVWWQRTLKCGLSCVLYFINFIFYHQFTSSAYINILSYYSIIISIIIILVINVDKT